jgi:hypothetical protein
VFPGDRHKQNFVDENTGDSICGCIGLGSLGSITANKMGLSVLDIYVGK